MREPGSFLVILIGFLGLSYVYRRLRDGR